ncbi:hypothetical protein ACGFZQ_41925 [Streptomyces sp. NPDC048254]|uniref:hypothetical protein n=1 Tax=Streptomyces sp. NPDC048254 TaxID=3365525 RepID=UPI003720E77B
MAVTVDMLAVWLCFVPDVNPLRAARLPTAAAEGHPQSAVARVLLFTTTGVCAALAWWSFRAVPPLLFLACVAYLAGGLDGRRFAIIGSCIHAVSLTVVVNAAGTMTEDLVEGPCTRCGWADSVCSSSS